MIRRQVYIAFLLLFPLLNIVAQPRLEKPHMYLGIHGGAVASLAMFKPVVSGMDKVLDAALLSGNGGLVFRYTEHKYCALQVELNYMQRGWREHDEATADSPLRDYTRRLDYLQLPLLMHIYFGRHACQGFVNVGPQIAYCLHESSTGTQHAESNEQYAPLDNPFDWGITGGVGVCYSHPRAGNIQLEARYNYCMSSLFSSSKMAYFSQSQMMNLSLNVAYLWPIKTKH